MNYCFHFSVFLEIKAKVLSAEIRLFFRRKVSKFAQSRLLISYCGWRAASHQMVKGATALTKRHDRVKMEI